MNVGTNEQYSIALLACVKNAHSSSNTGLPESGQTAKSCTRLSDNDVDKILQRIQRRENRRSKRPLASMEIYNTPASNQRLKITPHIPNACGLGDPPPLLSSYLSSSPPSYDSYLPLSPLLYELEHTSKPINNHKEVHPPKPPNISFKESQEVYACHPFHHTPNFLNDRPREAKAIHSWGSGTLEEIVWGPSIPNDPPRLFEENCLSASSSDDNVAEQTCVSNGSGTLEDIVWGITPSKGPITLEEIIWGASYSKIKSKAEDSN